MKKIILLFTAILAISCSKSDSSSSSTAKQLSITKLDGTVINDGAVLNFTTAGDDAALLKFYVKNSSSSAINVKAKCVSITNSDGSGMQFCFGQNCYFQIMENEIYPTDSHETVTVPANGQIGGESFHFQNSATGSLPISYVFEFYQYDANDNQVGNKVTLTYRYNPS
jgi:hypothetical protein